MFNSMGGRNLLVQRMFNTGAIIGQESVPIPGGYYLPSSDYNWYSYACSDPVNNSDISGYWNWGKFTGGLIFIIAGAGIAVLGAVIIGIGVGEATIGAETIVGVIAGIHTIGYGWLIFCTGGSIFLGGAAMIWEASYG